MKHLPVVTLPFLFIFLRLCANGQVQSNSEKHAPLFPLAVGNYWIYINSLHPDKPDTLRIVKTEITDAGTSFQYTGQIRLGGISLERNDSIFSFQYPFRSRVSHPYLEYFPSDKEIQFQIVIGGDATAYRTVSKINGSYKVNGKKYFDCYKFSNYVGNEHIIFCRGIGVIEIESSGKKITLADYKIE